ELETTRAANADAEAEEPRAERHKCNLKSRSGSVPRLQVGREGRAKIEPECAQPHTAGVATSEYVRISIGPSVTITSRPVGVARLRFTCFLAVSPPGLCSAGHGAFASRRWFAVRLSSTMLLSE